jgi:hypothetical protein
MVSIDDIARRVRGEIAAEFEAGFDAQFEGRIRACLARQPRHWLEEQLLSRVLHDTQEIPQAWAETKGQARDADERAGRVERIRGLELDEQRLAGFVARFRELDRDRLEAEGHLLDPPPKGTGIVAAEQRSEAGQALLQEAKDLLYALLFGDDADVRLERVQRELLTLTLPRAKAHTIASVLRAATGFDTEGAWRDPLRQADDDRAPSTLLQVEYGEVASELVGNGIAATLRLINNLEVNEQVLYARMEDVEESALD